MLDASNITADALRGLGREAFRTGGPASINPVPYATAAIGRELTGEERALVIAGKNAERTEAALGYDESGDSDYEWERESPLANVDWEVE